MAYEKRKMFERIKEFLDSNDIHYDVLEHEHVHSAKQAADIRGTDLEEAAKALILKDSKGRFFQCIVPGHRRLDLRRIKDLRGERNCSLAHPDSVLAQTGCPVGTVPPFANLFDPPLAIYADEDILSREKIVFSAGSHHHSIRMDANEWAQITGAQIEKIGIMPSAP